VGQQEVLTIVSPRLDPEELSPVVVAAIDAILEKKGEEVMVFDMRGFTPFVEFQVIASATSAVQAKVLLDSIVEAVERCGVKARVEGEPASGWVLIDFWDLVVHIFRPELRRYYNLEALWADLPWVKLNAANAEA
jgi:ribosome-associated protein